MGGKVGINLFYHILVVMIVDPLSLVDTLLDVLYEELGFIYKKLRRSNKEKRVAPLRRTQSSANEMSSHKG